MSNTVLPSTSAHATRGCSCNTAVGDGGERSYPWQPLPGASLPARPEHVRQRGILSLIKTFQSPVIIGCKLHCVPWPQQRTQHVHVTVRGLPLPAPRKPGLTTVSPTPLPRETLRVAPWLKHFTNGCFPGAWNTRFPCPPHACCSRTCLPRETDRLRRSGN